MADLELAVQKAVIGALAGMTAPGIVAGSTANVPVYDHQPENAAFPFVAISGQVTAADDAYDATMEQHTIYLAVWSMYRGQRQVASILREMRTRLHRAVLTLEIGEFVMCRVTAQTINPEPDDISYQGSMTVVVTASEG